MASTNSMSRAEMLAWLHGRVVQQQQQQQQAVEPIQASSTEPVAFQPTQSAPPLELSPTETTSVSDRFAEQAADGGARAPPTLSVAANDVSAGDASVLASWRPALPMTPPSPVLSRASSSGPLPEDAAAAPASPDVPATARGAVSRPPEVVTAPPSLLPAVPYLRHALPAPRVERLFSAIDAVHSTAVDLTEAALTASPTLRVVDPREWTAEEEAAERERLLSDPYATDVERLVVQPAEGDREWQRAQLLRLLEHPELKASLQAPNPLVLRWLANPHRLLILFDGLCEPPYSALHEDHRPSPLVQKRITSACCDVLLQLCAQPNAFSARMFVKSSAHSGRPYPKLNSLLAFWLQHYGQTSQRCSMSAEKVAAAVADRQQCLAQRKPVTHKAANGEQIAPSSIHPACHRRWCTRTRSCARGRRSTGTSGCCCCQ